MQPLEFYSAFILPLEKGNISYFVTGSIASIFYGEPRLTHDIDIVIHLTQADILKLTALFPLDKYYCPPEEVIQIESKRRPYGHFNIISHESGLKADIYPDANDPFHQWAFKNRKRIDIGNSFELWLAPPEYVIIRKLEFFREGGSEKHIEDIKKMLPQVQTLLDMDFLHQKVHERGLELYWIKICNS